MSAQEPSLGPEASFVIMCLVAEYADAATWVRMMQTQKAVGDRLRTYRPLKVRMEGARVFGEPTFNAIDRSDRLVSFDFPCKTNEEVNFMLLHALVSFKRDKDSFVEWYMTRLLDNIHRMDPYTVDNSIPPMMILWNTSKSSTWGAVVMRLHEMLTRLIDTAANGHPVCVTCISSILLFQNTILTNCKMMSKERVPDFMQYDCMHYLKPVAQALSTFPLQREYLLNRDRFVAEWAAHIKASYYGGHIVHVGKGGGRYYLNQSNTKVYIQLVANKMGHPESSRTLRIF